MTIDEFITANRCRQIYHMSEKGSWPSIKKYGLLSTTALLDFFEYSGSKRSRIESQLRREWKPVRIEHPDHGVAFIRDQFPMCDWPEKGIYLADLLEDGATEQIWVEFLNRKTFFWVRKYDLLKILCAPQYKDRAHWVLTVDTHALLERYADKSYLADQNSGSLYSGRKRGPNIFVPFKECPFKSNVIELAIDYGVPDVADFTISVTECIGSWEYNERKCKKVKHIWP